MSSLVASHQIWDLSLSRVSSHVTRVHTPATYYSLHTNNSQDIVTNPVHAIPFTHHHRSLVHHIDSYTTLLLPFTIELHFPSSTALTQLFALITLTPENSHTITITQSHTLYKPWTSSCSLPSIVLCLSLS